MKYLKWKLSEGVWGTYPVETIAAMGGKANTSEYVDGDGYRIAYLSEDVDISVLDSAWDVTEVTEAQALTFCRQFYADAVVMADGRVSSRLSADER
tara:strand:- start:69 stop:356 length:288 start_codon:yes stop_codon:yes gene_type:complete